MGRPAHCTCWLMGATAINQYCFLCQPFGCSCHTGVHFCFLKLAVSFGIKSGCCIVLQFPWPFRSTARLAASSLSKTSCQGAVVLLAQSDPPSHVSSNQDLVGLVLHCIQSISIWAWGNIWKKHHIPHLSQHLSQLLSPFWELPLSLYESTAKIGEAPAHAVEFPQLDLLQEPGPLGLLSLVRNSEKMVTIWWLIVLENSEIQPQSPWKSKPLLPLHIEKAESQNAQPQHQNTWHALSHWPILIYCQILATDLSTH